MKEKLAKALLLFTISMVLLSIQPAFAWSPPSERHDADSMWIEPSSVLLNATNPAHTVGYRFNITVYLNITSDDTFMYQFALLYNRTQLKATQAAFTTPPTSEFMLGHPTTALITIDTSFLGNGSVLATEALSGTDKISPPHMGSLIWVEFEVLIAPEEGETLTSKFDISSTFPADTWVWNPFGSDILDATYDGVYIFTSGVIPTYSLAITTTLGGTTDPPPGSHEYAEGKVVTVTAIPDAGYLFNHWELDGSYSGDASSIDVTMDTNHTLHANFTMPVGARIYVDPPEIINATMIPCSTFTINITIDDIGNMVICDFNLTYNSDVLSWIGIFLHEVQGQTPSANMIVDNDAGYLWVELNYSSPITTISPLALVTITFHVDAFGSSPLDLHDTELTDPNGQPIPHDVFDGFFMSVIRDVAIVDVVPARSWVYEGFSVEINVTAKNLGNVSESFDVKAYYDDDLIGTTHIVDLAPGAEATLTFIWNTSSVEPCHNYTIKGEATLVPYEYDTVNNVLVDGVVKVRISGDVNGDDKVDGQDLFPVARAFGSYPGHPRWNPEADLNGDDRIDGRDIFIVSINFGRSCPP